MGGAAGVQGGLQRHSWAAAGKLEAQRLQPLRLRGRPLLVPGLGVRRGYWVPTMTFDVRVVEGLVQCPFPCVAVGAAWPWLQPFWVQAGIGTGAGWRTCRTNRDGCKAIGNYTSVDVHACVGYQGGYQEA